MNIKTYQKLLNDFILIANQFTQETFGAFALVQKQTWIAGFGTHVNKISLNQIEPKLRI